MKTHALIMVILGVLLLGGAFYSAEQIPLKARGDFLEYAKSNPINSPGFPEAFMQMHAQRRLLQNFYLGAAGSVLLFVGTQAFCRERAKHKTNDA